MEHGLCCKLLLQIVVVVLAVHSYFPSISHAEKKKAVVKSTEAKSSKRKRRRVPVMTQGIYLGYLIYFDPSARYMFMLPEDKYVPRQSFFYDKKTRFSRFERKRRRRAKPSRIVEGQKLAVRYFSMDGVAVAEEVFIVDGEFNPYQYLKRKKHKKKDSAEDPKKEAKKE